MAAHAFAIANNDIVHIGWSVDAKIPSCTGFSIWRVPANAPADAEGEPLTSLATFVSTPSEPAPAPPAAAQPVPALIKGFKWRDLLKHDQHGIAFKYRVFAMTGPAAAPQKMDRPPMLTEIVTSTPHYRGVDAYFNRGILSTQSLSHALQKAGSLSVATLRQEITNPDSDIRKRLTAQLQDGVLSLLDQRASEGGECFAALYELTDAFLLGKLAAAGDKLHVILSTNTGDDKAKGFDFANKPARQKLSQSGAELISRYVPDGRSIGHNKFMVYVDAAGTPQAVLTGSTNWTASGLCTQNNNCLVVRSPELARRYLQYWHALKDDTEAAGIPVNPTKGVAALQGTTLRTDDAVEPAVIALPGNVGTVEVWPSPNTQGFIPTKKKVPGRPPTPLDMADLFQIIADARQAVLLLVFQPGQAGNDRSWTIVKQLSQVSRDKPGLFIRGAISDEAQALEFEAARNNRMDSEMVAPAGIMKDTPVWMHEIVKAGHAIVHDKIMVVDPFSPDCVVVTGSHNLGFKASYNNDENLVIVRGHRPLAEAYAAHIADVYEHHRWRWYNRRSAERAAAAAWVAAGSDPDTALDRQFDAQRFFKAEIPGDAAGDGWQDRYFDPHNLASLERQFWAGGGQPLPPRVPGVGPGMTSGLTAAESAFRAAKADLRKKQKGLAEDDDDPDDEG